MSKGSDDFLSSKSSQRKKKKHFRKRKNQETKKSNSKSYKAEFLTKEKGKKPEFIQIDFHNETSLDQAKRDANEYMKKYLPPKTELLRIFVKVYEARWRRSRT